MGYLRNVSKSLRLYRLCVVIGIDKFTRCKACLSDCTAQRSDGKFFVYGNDTTRILPSKYNVAAPLPDYGKTELLKYLDRL